MAAVVLGSLALGLASFWYVIPTPVGGHIATVRPFTIELTGPGLLDASNKVTIAARIHGYLTEVAVDRNQTVKEGQVLASLEATDLLNQLAAATADADAAEGAVAEARSSRAHAQAGFEKLKADVDRQRNLVTRGVASRVELDAADASFRQAQAELDRTSSAIDRAIAQAAAAAAQVKVLEARLADATIRSPINGVVVSRERNVGDLLTPGMPLLQVVDPKSIIIVARFDESAMASIEPEQLAKVYFVSDPHRPVTGKVMRLRRQVDQETREFSIEISLSELPPHWALGQRSTVAVQGRSPTSTLAVPLSFVARSGGQAGAWLERSGRARWTPARFGYAGAESVEVISGIRAGDVLVEPENRYEYEPVRVIR
jgi:HlyD family secretion protein